MSSIINRIPVFIFALALLAGGQAIYGQTNYDESKVPKYTLPDPLIMLDGSKVTTAEQWRSKRRPEVLKLFQTHVYGVSPAAPKKLNFKVWCNQEL